MQPTGYMPFLTPDQQKLQKTKGKHLSYNGFIVVGGDQAKSAANAVQVANRRRAYEAEHVTQLCSP